MSGVILSKKKNVLAFAQVVRGILESEDIARGAARNGTGR
jgi:hypothetical protein